MWPIATHVAHEVVSVYVFGTLLNCAKTAELTEMLFDMLTSQRNLRQFRLPIERGSFDSCCNLYLHSSAVGTTHYLHT